MKKYNITQPLISIHIPKTGGSSLNKVLANWYGDNLFFHYYNEMKGEMPIKYKLASNICIHGHFNNERKFGIKDYYPSVDQFIMFLRDPFEILVSRYFYVKRLENSNNSFRNGAPLIVDEKANEYLLKEINNKKYHPNILDYMPEKLKKSNYKEIINKKFIYIGLIADYQKSVDRLAEKLGFSSVKIGHENISSRHSEILPEIRNKFIETHELEYEIYNYVKTNYEKW